MNPLDRLDLTDLTENTPDALVNGVEAVTASSDLPAWSPPFRRPANSSQHMVPFVHEENGSKSLYFSIDQLQSRMCRSRPNELELDYTRMMMGFLLFNRHPRRIAMIGLGGGSLAKYCYHTLTDCNITVVEINPHVIALRKEFMVPDDDERFQVVEADGADFVREANAKFDVLVVDGYDYKGQPAQLCSRKFYVNCAKTLSDQGILVANLHAYHKAYVVLLDRLSQVFGGNVAELAANKGGNVVVFASNSISMSALNLRNSVAENWTGADEQPLLAPELQKVVRGWCSRRQ